MIFPLEVISHKKKKRKNNRELIIKILQQNEVRGTNSQKVIYSVAAIYFI